MKYVVFVCTHNPGLRSGGEIRASADAILSEYDEVPVRSFVMTLAHRRTREFLP